MHLRHKEGALKTDFNTELGDVSYQVACHLRVQNIGIKARDILNLVPGTTINTEERCSGHDGTYAVKVESHDHAVKIARPVVKKSMLKILITLFPIVQWRQIILPIYLRLSASLSTLLRLFEWLIHYKNTKEFTMTLTRNDLLSLEEYSARRQEFKAKSLATKKTGNLV
jgi:hypothetical protein